MSYHFKAQTKDLHYLQHLEILESGCRTSNSIHIPGGWGGGGGALPHMSYIGTCRCEGYGMVFTQFSLRYGIEIKELWSRFWFHLPAKSRKGMRTQEKEAFLNVNKNHRSNVIDRWFCIKTINSDTVLKRASLG